MQFWTQEHHDLYVKARLRRGTAFLQLGNLMQVGRAGRLQSIHSFKAACCRVFYCADHT